MVVQARHISTGQDVAIKLVNNIFKNNYETKKVLREIKLLRLFTDMGCKHIVKLIDLILV
jgi:serine/threonine protein kinase